MLDSVTRLMEEVLKSRPADEVGPFVGAVETVSFTTEELHEALAPYFSDRERHLTEPDSPFTPGVHTLRVDASPHDGGGAFEARIAIPGDAAARRRGPGNPQRRVRPRSSLRVSVR